MHSTSLDAPPVHALRLETPAILDIMADTPEKSRQCHGRFLAQHDELTLRCHDRERLH